MPSRYETSGPKLGQWVLYTSVPAYFFPALIIARSKSTGLVEVIGFPPLAQPVDIQNIAYDQSGNTANTWRYSVDVEPLSIPPLPIPPPAVFAQYVTESSDPYVIENGTDFYVPEKGGGITPAPPNYTAEDGTSVYTDESGSNPYTAEH